MNQGVMENKDHAIALVIQILPNPRSHLQLTPCIIYHSPPNIPLLVPIPLDHEFLCIQLSCKKKCSRLEFFYNNILIFFHVPSQ